MSICLSVRDLLLPRLPEILARRTEVQEKADGSYVTAADIYIQSTVIDFLEARHPQYTVISEELALPVESQDESASYLIIDPLDGTENFVSGLKEWGIGVSI